MKKAVCILFALMSMQIANAKTFPVGTVINCSNSTDASFVVQIVNGPPRVAPYDDGTITINQQPEKWAWLKVTADQEGALTSQVTFQSNLGLNLVISKQVSFNSLSEHFCGRGFCPEPKPEPTPNPTPTPNHGSTDLSAKLTGSDGITHVYSCIQTQ
jgi:hypothetical protein